MSEKKAKRPAEDHKTPAAYVVHTPQMRDGEPFAEALKAIYEIPAGKVRITLSDVPTSVSVKL